MSEPFWEELYRDDTVYAFGEEPNADVSQMADHFLPGSLVLDIGCGDGKNALFLAEKGFTVDAFDLSSAGVAKLLRLAAKRRVTVNAWPQDLTEFTFSKAYDVILSHGVLHLVEKTDWQRVLQAAQAHAKPGGYHLIKVFTDTVPASPDIAPFTRGLFHAGELASLYVGWEIVEASAYIKEDQHPNGVQHTHAMEGIIARRPL